MHRFACLFVVFALLHALAVVVAVAVTVAVAVACGCSKQKCTRNRIATGRMSIVYVRLHCVVCEPSARLQTVEYSFVFAAVVAVAGELVSSSYPLLRLAPSNSLCCSALTVQTNLEAFSLQSRSAFQFVPLASYSKHALLYFK